MKSKTSSRNYSQCITVPLPNKEEKKEPTQYIKATRDKINSGKYQISYYKAKGGSDSKIF